MSKDSESKRPSSPPPTPDDRDKAGFSRKGADVWTNQQVDIVKLEGGNPPPPPPPPPAKPGKDSGKTG